MPREVMVQRLQQSYNEHSVARGISVDGTLLEIFASPEGTYTIAKIPPLGDACIVDVGAAWQVAPDGVEGTGEKGTSMKYPISIAR